MRTPTALRGLPTLLRSRMGIRLRSALAAAAVVALALTVAGVGLVMATGTMVLRNVEAAATQRANEIVALLAAGSEQDLADALSPQAGEHTVVQVLAADGTVVAASAELAGQAEISPLRPGNGQTLRQRRSVSFQHSRPAFASQRGSGRVEVRRERFAIVAVGTRTAAGARVVLVGESIHEAEESTGILVAVLAVGLPLLTLVIGMATFWFVGRALRPVEAMRRQAVTISASSLHTRLPVPEARDEIAALATTMNTMLGRIEATSRSQRRFVADASHELRSPLSTIHAGLELLAVADLPERAATQVARMRCESARMAVLVEDLLLLARFDEDGPDLRAAEVDVDDLVYAEVDRIATVRPDLTIRSEVTPVRVVGDAHLLQRAIRNLVDNAIRHATTMITLELSEDCGVASVVVSNDGASIEPDDRERMFERFVRLDDDRSRDGGGTGLGLPIARDIAVAHGGTLTVRDPADCDGVAFEIRIPLERTA